MSLPALIAIAFAALFILWIVFSLLRGPAPFPKTGDKATNDVFLRSPESEVCRREVVARLFEREDLDFVMREGSREALALFQRERKRIAYFWIRQIRQEIGRIREDHVSMVRKSVDLHPSTEFKVAFDYLTVWVLCWLMTFAIYFLGPVHTRGMARYVNELAADLSSVVGKSALTSYSADFKAGG